MRWVVMQKKSGQVAAADEEMMVAPRQRRSPHHQSRHQSHNVLFGACGDTLISFYFLDAA